MGVPTPAVYATLDTHSALRRLPGLLAGPAYLVLKPDRRAGGRRLSVLVARAGGASRRHNGQRLDRDAGPLLLEANARPGLAIQIANGQGLLPRLQEVDRRLAADDPQSGRPAGAGTPAPAGGLAAGPADPQSGCPQIAAALAQVA